MQHMQCYHCETASFSIPMICQIWPWSCVVVSFNCVSGTDFAGKFQSWIVSMTPMVFVKWVNVIKQHWSSQFKTLYPQLTITIRMISPWHCVLAPPSMKVGTLSPYWWRKNHWVSSWYCMCFCSCQKKHTAWTEWVTHPPYCWTIGSDKLSNINFGGWNQIINITLVLCQLTCLCYIDKSEDP